MAIVELTVTLKGTVAQNNDVIDAVSTSLGWIEDPENLGFNSNGDTKEQHVEKCLIDYMKSHYRSKKQADQEVISNSDANTAFSNVVST